jgi:hypothetical protein
MIHKSNETMSAAATRLDRSDDILRRDNVVLDQPAEMPRPPGASPDTPVLLCPKCRQTLTFHNARTEPKPKGRSERIEVYFCREHGFWRLGSSGKLIAGM